jgi:hypothetical protein
VRPETLPPTRSIRLVDAAPIEPTKRQGTPQQGSGITRSERRTLGRIETAPPELSLIDRAAGKNLKKALGARTIAESAANAQHLAKMEQSAGTVALIEKLPGRLNSIAAFKVRDAFRLYEHCFPNDDEREPIEDIKDRIKQYEGLSPPDGADFHAHVFADKEGAVVGYAQGSTVPCDAGLFYYWQYGCVADRDYMKEHYGKDVNPREQGVLNTIHGVNAATLQATADRTGKPALAMLWEAEPRGLGHDGPSIRYTDLRLSIHNRAGGRVMIGVTADGEYVNLHLQPRLTADSEPIALHMMHRSLKYEPGEEKKRGELDKSTAEAMMLGWIENFRREKFPEKDVQEAENEIRRRFARCEKILLLPADEVPDVVALAKTDRILRKQIFKMYAVDNLADARRVYDEAIRSTPRG